MKKIVLYFLLIILQACSGDATKSSERAMTVDEESNLKLATNIKMGEVK